MSVEAVPGVAEPPPGEATATTMGIPVRNPWDIEQTASPIHLLSANSLLISRASHACKQETISRVILTTNQNKDTRKQEKKQAVEKS